ncbi:Sensitive to high expression protein 9-like [Colletotrichum gloeosporioides]|uniref:Sensitive to high expression protein 9, mitochondrial n=1 Tax=Colletotrichum gloeosporioides TaxID=474922 RepID=A0A8H4CBR0_COLGL|nr:Sensitive to high expression protein 9-like [Colletotrichum gloeosporioides]KAF3800829.1 Sensitive to high expression protein 9-like [Colletotrichum gloeosporioides]
MHPIARPASRLLHARIGLHTTAALARWPAATLPARRLYSSIPPFPPPPPPPSSSATKEEIKQASPTSDPSSPSSPSADPSSSSTTASTSASPPDDATNPKTSSTSTSSPSSSDKDAAQNPLPDVASKIYPALPPALLEKLSRLMDTGQTRLLTASTTLNALTGYAPIEAIKHQNTLLEARLAAAQDQVRTARHTYKTTNAKRATTQREVTTLLARKETWSPSDLERFTQLYRTDHELEQEVVAASEALTDAEHAEQALGQQLNAGILKRYHEEQIWSDRIRRASTWGTWGLMGVNVLLFLVLQFVAEPWKRKRLVRGVVEQEKTVLEGVTAELASLRASLAQRDGPAATGIEAAPADESAFAPEEVLAAKVEEPGVQDELDREVASALGGLEKETSDSRTWKEYLSDPALWRTLSDTTFWRTRLEDLYSERRIDLRMRDASILALEGAAAGATVAGGLALLLLRRT